jgi:hypothetical protein
MWIYKDKEQDKKQDMNGYARIKAGYKWINSWISMNELLDVKDIAGYTREYLEWKKIPLDIKRKYPVIFMLISIQRYPLISIIHIL